MAWLPLASILDFSIICYVCIATRMGATLLFIFRHWRLSSRTSKSARPCFCLLCYAREFPAVSLSLDMEVYIDTWMLNLKTCIPSTYTEFPLKSCKSTCNSIAVDVRWYIVCSPSQNSPLRFPKPY